MSIRKSAWLVTLIASMMLSACDRAPAVPEIPPDYIVSVRVLDKDVTNDDYVERTGTCTISGETYDHLPFTVRQEGMEVPYVLVIPIVAPTDIPIANPDKLIPIIKYTCTIYGDKGDVLICEATTYDGRPAPLSDDRDHDVVGGDGRASCWGNIQAGS